jgi:L-alanine-DL-glutamate epimerase-like enolase superfamily enzyme
MKLDGFDIFVIEVPCRADGSMRAERGVRSILVRLRDETGLQGWGESPVPAGAGPEGLDRARVTLREGILPALVEREFGNLESTSAAASAMLGEIPASAYDSFCGAELALLDLTGRRFRQSAGDILGPPRQPAIHYGGVITSGSEAVVKSMSLAFRRTGVRDVMLRVDGDLDRNLARLDIAREILGADVNLRINADGCWDPGDAATQLEAMAPYRLAGVEQPVPATDVDGLAAVTAIGACPVIARDNVVTTGDAIMLAARRACDGFSVSISRCGGLANAGSIHRIARDAGLECRMGADPSEVGIMAAAGRLFATRCEGIRWCECSPALAALAGYVTDPPPAPDPGQPAMASKGHGLGIRVLETMVDRYASQRFSVS